MGLAHARLATRVETTHNANSSLVKYSIDHGQTQESKQRSCGSVIGTDNLVRVQESMHENKQKGNRAGGNRFSPLVRALFARAGMADLSAPEVGVLARFSASIYRATQGHTGKYPLSAFYFLSTLRVTRSLR